MSVAEAVLGAKIKAPTPTGPVTVTVPKGANTGMRASLEGKGRAAAGRRPGRRIHNA